MGGTWATMFEARFGNVDDFLRSHPEAFRELPVNRAGARARAPTQGPSTTVMVTPAAPGRQASAAPASGEHLALLHPAL